MTTGRRDEDEGKKTTKRESTRERRVT